MPSPLLILSTQAWSGCGVQGKALTVPLPSPHPPSFLDHCYSLFFWKRAVRTALWMRVHVALPLQTPDLQGLSELAGGWLSLE